VSRAASSQISFADWELMRQGLVLEPLLQAISDFLDDHKELVAKVRDDLRRGLKKPDTGRSGMAPQEVLRSLILMRVKSWDYRELRERIADGYTLRQFTGFHCRPVPKHNAFHRAFVRLTPATLRTVNELVVKAAVGLGLEDGTKLRVDTTVVQTDIHYPPTPRCYGMSCASCRACLSGSATCWGGASKASATKRAQRGGACKRSSG